VLEINATPIQNHSHWTPAIQGSSPPFFFFFLSFLLLNFFLGRGIFEVFYNFIIRNVTLIKP